MTYVDDFINRLIKESSERVEIRAAAEAERRRAVRKAMGKAYYWYSDTMTEAERTLLLMDTGPTVH